MVTLKVPVCHVSIQLLTLKLTNSKFYKARIQEFPIWSRYQIDYKWFVTAHTLNYTHKHTHSLRRS